MAYSSPASPLPPSASQVGSPLSVSSPPVSPGSIMSPGGVDATGIASPRSPQSSVVTTLTAQTAPSQAPPRAPEPKSIWEQLRYSHSIWGTIYRLGAPPPSTRTTREVFVNDPASNERERFVDNTVVTSKYTLLNFIPLFLFEQFSRFANMYFLIVCVLQAIPEISITNGLPTTALPLSFVLFFDAIVTAREDYNRHRDDARANARKVSVCRDGSFKELQWRDIRVGDVVKIPGGEEIPADLVFLAASCEDPDQRGVCHVQTAQLDGETNLKMRNALDKTVAVFTDDAAASAFKGKVVCEEPHENFAKFNGSMYLEAGAKRAYGLDANATLLRGCVVKNVTFVYGVAVYTGRETKVRVKQSATTAKKASVEAEINRYIVALVATQLALCVIATIGYAVWTSRLGQQSWYLAIAGISAGDVIARFFTFFLLISNIIPISLYVTMKLARTAQAFFMNSDIQCVYADKELVEKSGGEEGLYPLRVRSLDLNDELGQISHIFSDKTGTLTSNYMNFRKLSVNGVVYGRGSTAIGMARRRRLGLETAELEALMHQQASMPKEVPHVDFVPGSETHPGRELRGPKSDLNGSGAKQDPLQAEALHSFLLNCCLNHTVVLEAVQDKHTGEVRHQLSASSPDEEAFVLAAKYFGYEFVNRQKDVAIVRIHGVEHRFRVVVIVPYSSARQMMSVVIEDLSPSCPPERKFTLYSKGSDVRMFKLNVTETRPASGEGLWMPANSPMTASQLVAAQRALINTTKAQLMEMAEDGLRTLCFSYRPLSEAFLKPWLERYETHLSDIQQKRLKDAKLPNKIDDTAAEMERDLLFQGATANEDKLQEEVPETIALLGQAGIKIYMCTGDKQETAINIAFACRMLTNEYLRIVVTSEELLSDKILEDAAKKRKDRNEADAAAMGVTPADHRELLKWVPPEPVEQVLDYNARLKLRSYANVSRAKAAKGQEFVRPRALVIDEPVMNMVWPSIPQMPKVTAASVRDVYKDTLNLIAKVQALQQALSVPTVTPGDANANAVAGSYMFYDDLLNWKESESDVLRTCDPTALAEDSEERARIASILKAAHMPDLLAPNGAGVKHLYDGLQTILEVQKRIKVIDEAINPSTTMEGLPGAAAAGAGGSSGFYSGAGAAMGGKEELDALHKQAERLAADLGPQLEAAYKAAKACYLACGLGMQQDLLVIAESCRAVVCCRCRPDQKKRMLELIRYNVPTSRCLAVGDGANDVDMIQAANVGVGIVGPEGVQAANASDYATGRFRFLQRLLLVHGRWNYNRMAMLVSYMFYKNVLYAIIQYLYTIVAAWSGQKFYIEAASQTFNLIFTGLPILVAAVYDQDVGAVSALTFPYLYSDGLYRRRLNLKVLIWWLTTSVYEAALIFVFTYFGAYWTSLNGSSPYVFEFGSWAFSALIVVVNVRLAFNVTRHTWLFDVAWLGSAAVWFPILIFFCSVSSLSDNSEGMIPYLFGNGAFWLWLLVTVVASQLHNFIIGTAKRMFAPEYRDLVQEYEILMAKAADSGDKKKLGWYRRCLTCGMRRDTVSKNRSAEQLLSIIDSIYPRQPLGGDPAAVLSKELSAGDTPASASVTAASASGAAAAGSGPASSPRSPNANSPLLADPAANRLNTPTGSSAASAAAASSAVPVKLESTWTPADLDVDFGPDLSNLDPNPSALAALCPALCRCRRVKSGTTFRDTLRLPTREDEAEELIEWPINEQMRVSLQMRRRQLYEEAARDRSIIEHPETSLKKVKLDLLRARLSSVIEHGRASASEEDEARAAAALAEIMGGHEKGSGSPRGKPQSQPHRAASQHMPLAAATSPASSAAAAGPGSGVAAAAGVAPIVISPSADTITPGSPASLSPVVAAAAVAVPVTAAPGVTGAGTAGTVIPSARDGTPSWALLQDIARVHRQYHERKKGSVTDFSVDDRSSAKMGDAISSVGRRITTLGRRFSSRRLTGTPSFSLGGLQAQAQTQSSQGYVPATSRLSSVGGDSRSSQAGVGLEMTSTPTASASASQGHRPSSAPHPVVAEGDYLLKPNLLNASSTSPSASPDSVTGLNNNDRTVSSVAAPGGINVNGSASNLTERVMTDPCFVSDRRASGVDLASTGATGATTASTANTQA